MSKENQKAEHKKYLETHVNVLIKPLLIELVQKKPEDVVDFMVEWCNGKGREIENARKNKDENDSHLPDSEDDSFQVEGEEDDEFDMDAIRQKQRKTKKKNAISAEAYGEYNKLEKFEPRVIKKTEEQKQMIRDILGQNFMFSNLEEKNKLIVIDAMEIREFKGGDQVIKQGDDGEELFIVSTGILTCTKLFPDQTEPTFLKEYNTGEVFGELALMYNAPRAASITAKCDSQCFVLDRDTFNHIVKTAAIKKRERFDGFLQKIDILSTLNNYEREKICDCLETETFNKGEYVIREGDEGEKFYLIEEGQAEALQQKNGNEEKVYEFKENDYFGELALLHNDKRKASVRVVSEKLLVAAISKIN